MRVCLAGAQVQAMVSCVAGPRKQLRPKCTAALVSGIVVQRLAAQSLAIALGVTQGHDIIPFSQGRELNRDKGIR